jgi:hypothetical protein
MKLIGILAQNCVDDSVMIHRAKRAWRVCWPADGRGRSGCRGTTGLDATVPLDVCRSRRAWLIERPRAANGAEKGLREATAREAVAERKRRERETTGPWRKFISSDTCVHAIEARPATRSCSASTFCRPGASAASPKSGAGTLSNSRMVSRSKSAQFATDGVLRVLRAMFNWHAMRDKGFSNTIVRGMSPEEAPGGGSFFSTTRRSANSLQVCRSRVLGCERSTRFNKPVAMSRPMSQSSGKNSSVISGVAPQRGCCMTKGMDTEPAWKRGTSKSRFGRITSAYTYVCQATTIAATISEIRLYPCALWINIKLVLDDPVDMPVTDIRCTQVTPADVQVRPP